MTEPNLFQEAQEDFERQRIEDLWKRYGLWVVVGALLVVIGTAGASAYRSWKAEQNQTVTGAYLEVAKQDNDADKGMDLLKQFADTHAQTNQADFALLHAAALASSQNDTAKAVELYQRVAQDSMADPAFQQLAVLLSVQAQMDSGDAVALSAQLDPLTIEGGAWRFAAMEAQGYLALKKNNKEKAVQLFTVLTQDTRVPAGMASRAASVLQSLN